jgi:hypothetical protein
MRGSQKRQTITRWFGPLFLFPTAGTRPAQRSGRILSGPKADSINRVGAMLKQTLQWDNSPQGNRRRSLAASDFRWMVKLRTFRSNFSEMF